MSDLEGEAVGLWEDGKIEWENRRKPKHNVD